MGYRWQRSWGSSDKNSTWPPKIHRRDLQRSYQCFKSIWIWQDYSFTSSGRYSTTNNTSKPVIGHKDLLHWPNNSQVWDSSGRKFWKLAIPSTNFAQKESSYLSQQVSWPANWFMHIFFGWNIRVKHQKHASLLPVGWSIQVQWLD